jgi:glycosyltransferase involved in cell wall biosynthesis
MPERAVAERGPRPPASVIVPFAGTRDEAGALIAALHQIELRPGDELIVVDNSGEPIVPEADGVTVVRASAQASAYYARNEGAARAAGEWLFFTDSDCRPYADVLDRFFDGPVDDSVGALVGEIEGVADQTALVSRYARSRGHLRQEGHWLYPYRPWGVTANLLVRRSAWESVGGFLEGIRSGGDTEFSWRLQDAGWELGYRPKAIVEHIHRDSVRRLARQAARYAAGRAWVMRRYPGSFERPRLLRRLGRCAVGVLVWAVTGRFERAAFKALDAVYVISESSAFFLSNTPPPAVAGRTARMALLAGAFPAADAPAEARTADAGAVVEAARRPVRVDRTALRSLRVAYGEDDGILRRIGAMAWLARRSPRAAAANLRVLFRLAAPAQRLAAAGVETVHAIHPERADDAVALAHLLSIGEAE